MRRTRFMSVLFLVLSAAFFCVPSFRQAFTIPIITAKIESDHAVPSWATVSQTDLSAWAKEAETQKDARTLAFVALHTDNNAERERLGNLAVSIDPKLGWIYFSLINVGSANGLPRSGPKALDWARRFQAYEPDNAVGYLLEGEYWRENAPSIKQATNTLADYQAREKATDWRAAMEKGFAAPKFNTHNTDRFDLERKVLQEHGAATPARMLVSVAAYPINNLLNIRQFAGFEADYLGKNAEDAKKMPEALQHYWLAFHFGERMHLGAQNLIEQLIAIAVTKLSGVRLAPALRTSGNADGAEVVDNTVAEMMADSVRFRGNDILAESSNYYWNAMMVVLFEGLVTIFGALTVVSVLYVNAKRFLRRDVKGQVWQTTTIAENYLPVLLFIFCVGLYISYYPYARNFQHYMTATGQMHDLESVFTNSIAVPGILPHMYELPVGNPFVPYVWYAGAGVLLVVALFLIGGRAEKPAPVEENKTMAVGAGG